MKAVLVLSLRLLSVLISGHRFIGKLSSKDNQLLDYIVRLLIEIEPEFKQELIQLIEHEMEFHSTAGIKSRGKKLLKKLYAQLENNF